MYTNNFNILCHGYKKCFTCPSTDYDADIDTGCVYDHNIWWIYMYMYENYSRFLATDLIYQLNI